MNKIFLLLLMVICCFGCNTNSQTPATNRAANNSQVTQKLEQYKQQQHRLAFNGCEFSYNEQSFRLGMTIKELVDLFGPYDYQNIWYYVWKEAGIVIATNSKEENPNSISEYVYIYMNTKVSDEYKISQRDRLNHKKDYFLINGIPHRYDIYFSDFVTHSTYTLGEDITADNYNYYIYNECENKKYMEYTIDVNGGIWNYVGNGHMRLKKDLNQNNDNLIESIGIGYANDSE